MYPSETLQAMLASLDMRKVCSAKTCMVRFILNDNQHISADSPDTQQVCNYSTVPHGGMQ